MTIIRIDCNEAYITSVSLVLYMSVGFARLNLSSVKTQPSFRHRGEAEWKTVVSRYSTEVLHIFATPSITKYYLILPQQILQNIATPNIGLASMHLCIDVLPQ